jgi:hypothetical protein
MLAEIRQEKAHGLAFSTHHVAARILSVLHGGERQTPPGTRARVLRKARHEPWFLPAARGF